MNKLFFALIFTFIAVLLPKCSDKSEVVPYVYVYLRIDIEHDPDFFILSTVGSSASITGGYRGIIIYRKSLEEFIALDRTCTYDVELESARVQIDDSGIMAVDTTCGSVFSLVLDGFVVEGPATYGLKRYQTFFNQATGVLTVTN